MSEGACTGTCEVVNGRRYAAGLKVPFGVALIPGSPLADLKDQAAGGAVVSSEVTGWLAQQGWSNPIIYPAGQSPFSHAPVAGSFTEPDADHEYIVVATRSGPTGTLGTDDPAWFGALLWIADAYPSTEMDAIPTEPGVPAPTPAPAPVPAPNGEQTRELVGVVLFGGLALAGIGLLVWALSSDGARKNPTHQPSYQQLARWKHARRRRQTRSGWGSQRAKYR